jgi:hypothetical protein
MRRKNVGFQYLIQEVQRTVMELSDVTNKIDFPCVESISYSIFQHNTSCIKTTSLQ